MKVSDIMTRQPIVVSPSDDAATALNLMRARKIRHTPVVSADGELLGILSDRDLLGAPALAIAEEGDEADEQPEALRAIKVDEIYTRGPETIDEDAPLEDAARILLENKIACLPVMNGSELAGILTEADFVKFVLRQLEGELRSKHGDAVQDLTESP